eukprot:COSAG02_NODE_7091_length_3189_cov_1493.496764_2_plen_87_part_00
MYFKVWEGVKAGHIEPRSGTPAEVSPNTLLHPQSLSTLLSLLFASVAHAMGLHADSLLWLLPQTLRSKAPILTHRPFLGAVLAVAA